MTSKHLLDPELLPIFDFLGSFKVTDESLPELRAARAAIATTDDTRALGVARDEIFIPGATGPDVRCLVYKPIKSQAVHAGYLHIHGGGYILGTPEMADATNLKICAELGAVVVSVDYRLAPEHPIPAPLDDCYAALAWLHNNSTTLRVDPTRIAIGGESAGGGLAAALALKARDAGEYAICFQLLTYPMLDDRTGSDSEPGDPLVGEFLWTRSSNQYGWNSYLGDAPRTAPQVPARAESLKGLPPTWLLTATLDLFRDENIDYARRLMSDGVVVELAVFPGACHGFQAVPGTDLLQRYERDALAALGRGLSVTRDRSTA